MHELLYGKLEYMKMLADKAGVTEQMAQNQVLQSIFDYDKANNVFYDKENISPEVRQSALKSLTAGWYGQEDFFASLAKDLGVKYNPNMSLGRKLQTDNATNHEVGERYKFGKKSQQGIESAATRALGNKAY
jgi:hypothetical protein